MAGPIRATEIKPERVKWLAPDKLGERIPCGMLTIVGGKPDQGKGLFATYLAAQVSRSQVISRATGKRRPGRVLYSAIEDSHGLMTRPRLEAAGANLRRVDLWRFMMPAHLDALFQLLEQNEYDLLIVDPLAAHLSHGVSRHSDNIRSVLNPLGECIEETGTAVVVVEHVLKRVSPNAHPISAIGGNGSGVVAAARMAYLFGVDPSDKERRILAAVKHNIRDAPKALAFEIDVLEMDEIGDVPNLMVDGECDFDPMRMLQYRDGPGRTGAPSDKRAAAAEWLTNYLWAAHKAGKRMAVTKIYEDAKQAGMNTKTLRRAGVDMGVIRLTVDGKIATGTSSKGTTWELPNDIIDLMKQVEGDVAGGPAGVPPEIAGEIQGKTKPARASRKKTPPTPPKPQVDAKEPDGSEISDEDLAAWLNQGPVSAADVEPGKDEKKDKDGGSDGK